MTQEMPTPIENDDPLLPPTVIDHENRPWMEWRGSLEKSVPTVPIKGSIVDAFGLPSWTNQLPFDPPESDDPEDYEPDVISG